MNGIAKARIALGCSIVMSLAWITGLFSISYLKFVMQIILCACISLQGFFIFIFYCVMNTDIRRELGLGNDKSLTNEQGALTKSDQREEIPHQRGQRNRKYGHGTPPFDMVPLAEMKNQEK